MPPFLTPPTLPEERECKSIKIPASFEWLGIFDKMLIQLMLPWNWEQRHDSDITIEETVAFWETVANAHWDGDVCGGTNNAPFWDDSDGDDADGEEDEGGLGSTGFPWYENVSDWIVEAFLATSFTPAAAVTFVTTARKIRLAFRTANWGALADIFIDNVLIDTVDTYSPELDVAEYAYDLDLIQPAAFTVTAQASETAVLRIVHRGEANSAAVPTGDGYGISIIRKRLQSSVFTPSSTAPTVKRIYRVLRSGKMQYSDDGGETWDDADTLPEYPPLPPRSEMTAFERRCLAARNAAEVIRLATIETITVWNNTTDPLQTISDLIGFIAGAVALFLGNPMLALVATGFELFQNVLAVIEAGLDTAWDTETTDKLTCLLFELASDDGNGKVTFDFEGVRYRGNEVYSDARLIVIHHWLLGIIGSTGLNLAGATTSVSSWDCTECVDEWCYEFDFSLGAQGWTIPDTGSTGALGAGGIVDTLNNAAGYRAASARINFTETHVTEIEMEYDLVRGTVTDVNGNPCGIIYRLGGGSETSNTVNGVTGTNQISSITPNQVIDTVRIHASCGNLPGSGNPGGSTLIKRVTMRGTGTNPFGTDNCEV